MTETNGHKHDLTVDDILDANDVDIRPVDCPKWGGTVYVRSMDLPNYAELEQWIAENRGNDDYYENARLEMLARTLCDSEGNLLFVDRSHVEKLRSRNAGHLDKCWEQALIVNNMGSDTADILKALEAAGKK